MGSTPNPKPLWDQGFSLGLGQNSGPVMKDALQNISVTKNSVLCPEPSRLRLKQWAPNMDHQSWSSSLPGVFLLHGLKNP